MTDALRYEWVRIRTLRSTYWLTGLALVLPAVLVGLLAAFLPDRMWAGMDQALGGALLLGGLTFSPLPMTAIFMAMIGAFAFGHEYRYGTMLQTLAAVPQRNKLMLAKLLMVSGWSLAVAVLGLLLNWALVVGLSGHSLDLFGDPIGPAILGYLVYTVLWGLLGVGLAALLRNLPLTVVFIFVVPLVVEPLLRAVLLLVPGLDSIREAANYFPFAAGLASTSTFTASETGQLTGGEPPTVDSPARVVSGLTFALWIALILSPAWILFKKRDA
ncbi:ABC transporter permease [Flindersiella endophytica]